MNQYSRMITLSLLHKKGYHNIYHFVIGCTTQISHTNAVRESTYALPEKTKRGPPTNKNIPVRNMKAQITNMSINEKAGFKSEYHVRCFILFFK